jgi:hypothetical protein
MIDSGTRVKTSAPRRKRRWLIVIGLGVVLLVSSAYAILRAKFDGPDLADNIASLLNKRMRGRIEIGSIEWSPASLKKIVTGGWVPLTIRDVRVWDDCALSAAVSGDEGDALRSGDPNEDCTPDDRPDPDPRSKRKPRKLLLRTDLVTVELDIHALMFGRHDFVFRNVWIHGGDALLEQTLEPYPLHAYDRTIVSMVTAFYPRMKATFHAGIFADAPPPIFDLRDIHVAGLDMTLHMAPSSSDTAQHTSYGFTVRLEDVDVDAGPTPSNSSYFYMDPTDPLVAKFYVRLAVTARRGLVRVIDEGPRAAFRLPLRAPRGELLEIHPPAGRTALYQLPVTDIKLDRLAQMPSDWAQRDYVANTLELDLEARTVPCATLEQPSPDLASGASIHLSGELFNYWDRPYDGAWNVKLDAKNLGPTVRSCIIPTMGGDQLEGTISLTGPFVAQPAVGLDLTGVDFDVPLGQTEAPLRLTLAELHGKIDLVNEDGYIEKTKALVRGGKEPGEVELSATFGLRPYHGNAQIEILKAIDVGRFLPEDVAASVGKYLQGRLRAIGNIEESFELSSFDLSLGATPRERAVRFHHGRLFTSDQFDTIGIEKVYVDAGKSHAEINGMVSFVKNAMDVRINGNYPDLDVWLRRFGLPVMATSASGGGDIRITGPLNRPKVTVRNTTLAGVPCLDKLELVDLVHEGNRIEVSKVTSPGLGGQLTGNGRIVLGGPVPVVERLELIGSRLDASKLCGLKGIVKGTVDEANLQLRGDLDLKRGALDWLGLVQAYVRADHLTIGSDRYSGIAACVNRKDDRACRRTDAKVEPTALRQCEDGKRAAAGNGSGFCAVARATRDAGGVLDATIAQLPALRTGRTTAPARLGGVVSAAGVPLALFDRRSQIAGGGDPDGSAGGAGGSAPRGIDRRSQIAGGGDPDGSAGSAPRGIDRLRGKPAARNVGGVANVTLHLQGRPVAPQADGTIEILRSWLATGFLGDVAIDVDPTVVRGVPGLQFRGKALAGRLELKGSLGTAAPYPVELEIKGHRIEVDPFVDLRALIGVNDPVQAWASGTVTLRTELASSRPAAPEAWIELTELTMQIDNRTGDGRMLPLVVRAKNPSPAQRPAMSLYITPSSVELACRDSAGGDRSACSTVLETPAGDIVIEGQATQSAIAIEAKGDLDLGKLRSLLDQQFGDIAGHVRLVASIKGGLDNPKIEAAIDLDPDQRWQSNEAARLSGLDPRVRDLCAEPTRGGADASREPRKPVDGDEPARPGARAGAPTREADRAHDEQRRAAGGGGPDGSAGGAGVLPRGNDRIGRGPVKLRPLGSETTLCAPHGLIKLARGTVGFTDVLVRVTDDQNLPDPGDLRIAGTIALDGLTPKSWSVLLSGKLSGKLLQVALPTYVAQASGMIKIEADDPLLLSGTGSRPALSGTLTFDRLALLPRGVHRELMFSAGTIDITTDAAGNDLTYNLAVADVAGALDEGRLSDVSGTLRVRNGELVHANLHLDAENIPFRIPQTLDLSLSATDVAISRDGPSAAWRVRGAITVVDGAYLRNFEITDTIRAIGVNSAPSKPFWEEYPTLGNADLALTLTVQRFAVRSNIGTIEFKSDIIDISGTPRDPHLDGQIRVTHGNFHIPATLAEFTRTSGTVDFAENQPASNPTLNVISDADYRDLSGQDHVITAKIGGTLQLPTWDLSTSTGYTKSQTLSLLVLGRNPEALRRSLGDQSLGGDPTRVDPTTNPSQGFADQIVKDLAGDWVSSLIGSSLTQLTGLDVLRIEIGLGSIGLHVEKRMLENAKMLGDFEQTIRGTTIKWRAELNTPFVISLQGGYLNQNYYDPAEQDIEDFNVKFVYRVFIP